MSRAEFTDAIRIAIGRHVPGPVPEGLVQDILAAAGDGDPGPAHRREHVLNPKIDYKAIAIVAVDLLCSLGCYGLDPSQQRRLWQEALDLDRRLHPDRPPIVVWTEEEGDVDPPRKPGMTPTPETTERTEQ